MFWLGILNILNLNSSFICLKIDYFYTFYYYFFIFSLYTLLTQILFVYINFINVPKNISLSTFKNNYIFFLCNLIKQNLNIVLLNMLLWNIYYFLLEQYIFILYICKRIKYVKKNIMHMCVRMPAKTIINI